MYVVVGRFGLTPDETEALRTSKAWKKAQRGHEIDRNILKLSANRPSAPITKKNIDSIALQSTSDRIREEVGSYFEDIEHK